MDQVSDDHSTADPQSPLVLANKDLPSLPSWATRQTAQVPPNTHRLAECQGCIDETDTGHTCSMKDEPSSPIFASSDSNPTPALRSAHNPRPLTTSTILSSAPVPPPRLRHHPVPVDPNPAALPRVQQYAPVYANQPQLWHDDPDMYYAMYGGYHGYAPRRSDHGGYYEPPGIAERRYCTGCDDPMCGGKYEPSYAPPPPPAQEYVQHPYPVHHGYRYAPPPPPPLGDFRRPEALGEVYSPPQGHQGGQQYVPAPQGVGHYRRRHRPNPQQPSLPPHSGPGVYQVQGQWHHVPEDYVTYEQHPSVNKPMINGRIPPTSAGRSLNVYSVGHPGEAASISGGYEHGHGPSGERPPNEEISSETSVDKINTLMVKSEKEMDLFSAIDDIVHKRNEDCHTNGSIVATKFSEINNNSSNPVVMPTSQQHGLVDSSNIINVTNSKPVPNFPRTVSNNNQADMSEKTKPEVIEEPIEPTPPSTSFVIDLSDGEDGQKKSMNLSDAASRFMRRASLRHIKRSAGAEDKEFNGGDRTVKNNSHARSSTTNRPSTSVDKHTSDSISSFTSFGGSLSGAHAKTTGFSPGFARKSLRSSGKDSHKSADEGDHESHNEKPPRAWSAKVRGMSPAATRTPRENQAVPQSFNDPKKVTRSMFSKDENNCNVSLLSSTKSSTESSFSRRLYHTKGDVDKQSLDEAKATILNTSHANVSAKSERPSTSYRRWGSDFRSSIIPDAPTSQSTKTSIVDSLRTLRKLKKASKERLDISTDSGDDDTNDGDDDGNVSETETYTVHADTEQDDVKAARAGIDRAFGVGELTPDIAVVDGIRSTADPSKLKMLPLVVSTSSAMTSSPIGPTDVGSAKTDSTESKTDKVDIDEYLHSPGRASKRCLPSVPVTKELNLNVSDLQSALSTNKTINKTVELFIDESLPSSASRANKLYNSADDNYGLVVTYEAPPRQRKAKNANAVSDSISANSNSEQKSTHTLDKQDDIGQQFKAVKGTLERKRNISVRRRSEDDIEIVSILKEGEPNADILVRASSDEFKNAVIGVKIPEAEKVRSKPPPLSLVAASVSGRTSAPIVSPLNTESTYRSFGPITLRSVSRNNEDTELSVYNATQQKPSVIKGQAPKVSNPQKNVAALPTRPYRPYSAAAPPVISSTSKLSMNTRQRSNSRPRQINVTSKSIDSEGPKEQHFKRNDRGRLSARPPTSSAHALSSMRGGAGGGGGSTSTDGPMHRSCSTGALQAGRSSRAASRSPVRSTSPLLALQNQFKKRMSYKPLEAVARSKEERRNSLAKVRSVDDVIGDNASLDDPSDLSTASNQSSREGTFDDSDVAESEITKLSTSVACDLEALSNATKVHSNESWQKQNYDGVIVNTIHQLSEKVKVMTGQLYQKLRESQEGGATFSPTETPLFNSDLSQSFDDGLKLEEVLRNLKESVRRLQTVKELNFRIVFH